jgi:glucosyl-3-phosphoglycerate synthase
MPPRSDHFTFAVVGHNEATSLRYALEQALAAALPGEEVWFVDSGSTDDSVELARSLPVRVLEAPIGKGRAVAAVLERCTSGYLCLLDADLTASEVNIPVALRDAAARSAVDMLVGEFDWPERRRSVVPGIYVPLVGRLFPEVLRQVPYRPTSGFRVLNAELDLGTLPPGYGLETHLNIVTTLSGATIATAPLGPITGPVPSLDHMPQLGCDVATAALDLAVAAGRLDPANRSVWEQWVEAVLEVIARQPPVGRPDHRFQRELALAIAQPLPAA